MTQIVEGTIYDIAKRLGWNYGQTRDLIAVLCRLGVARAVGFEHTTSKGRSRTIWQLPERIDVRLIPLEEKCVS